MQNDQSKFRQVSNSSEIRLHTTSKSHKMEQTSSEEACKQRSSKQHTALGISIAVASAASASDSCGLPFFFWSFKGIMTVTVSAFSTLGFRV